MNSLFLFLAFMMPFSLAAYEFDLAVMAIFRDEAPYLKEWIEYYKLQGAQHFYLYNHLSVDNYQEVLSPYIARGEVELVEWTKEASCWAEWDAIQKQAYGDALEKVKYRSKWIAIVDIDEFIVPVSLDRRGKSLTPIKKPLYTLVNLLSSFEKKSNIGGVCIPWVFFGTSHIQKIPEDRLLIETLLLNSGPAAGGDLSKVWAQGAYKSIVRPEYVDHIPSPHFCVYVAGREHVMLDVDRAQINHYWTRDETYLYEIKIPRRAEWNQEIESVLQNAAAMNGKTPYSQPILKFVPELKRRMNLSL